MLKSNPTFIRLHCYFSLREKARKDIFWLAGILGYELLYKHHAPFHKEALSHIKQNKYSLTEIARGFFKTTLFTICDSIQEILNNANIRILIISWTGPVAKSMLDEASAHFLINENLRFLFPEICPSHTTKPETQQWNQDGICVKRPVAWKECTIEALGADQNTTGKHFDRIKCDDIVVLQNTRTVDQINKTKTFIAKLPPLLLQHIDDIRLSFVGTSWEPDDPYQDIKSGKMLAPNGKNFSYHKTPAEHTVTKIDYKIDDKSGELLALKKQVREATYPIFYPLEKLDGFKSANAREYSAFYLLDPEDTENALWTRDMMQLYNTLPVGLNLSIWGGVDPSISEKDIKKVSDTAVVVIGIDNFNDIWFLDYEISRGAGLIVDHFFKLADRWRTQQFPFGNIFTFRCFSVETIAFQKLIFRDLQLKMKETGKWIPVREDKPYTDKTARIMIFDGPMRNKKIHVRTDMVELQSQIIRFGKPQTKVDILDAGAQAYKTSMINLNAESENKNRPNRNRQGINTQRYIRGAL
jgi:hypothetical protein